MHDEARCQIERLIVGVVEAPKKLGFEIGRHDRVIPNWPNIAQPNDLVVKTMGYAEWTAKAHNHVDINKV
jgi:hypothetical protein